MGFMVSFETIQKVSSDALTIDQMAHYYFDYARSKKSYSEIRAKYRRYFDPVKHFHPGSLTPQHVELWHKAIGEQIGTPTANHALRLLRTIYNYCARMNHFNGLNPASVIRAYPENSRDRFLSEDEMPIFLAALDEVGRNGVRLIKPKTRDLIHLMLFTGVRSRKCRKARWEDINLKDRTWMVRKDKNGEGRLYPLDECAVEALLRRNPQATGWVFPGDRRESYMSFPRRDWDKIRARFPEHLVAHDLRRTLATWELEADVPLEVVQESLGHKSIQSTKVYAKTQTKKIRKAVRAAVHKMTGDFPPSAA